MGRKKQVKVQVKKRKIKYKRIFFLLLVFAMLYFLGSYILNLKMTNIYIKNNHLLSDNEVIKQSGLKDYPSFILTTSREIINNLKANKLIKNVEIKKQFWGKVIIDITEYKPLFIEKDTLKIILSNGTKIDNTNNINNIPYLISPLEEDKEAFEDEYSNLMKKFNLLDSNILLKISEVRYAKSDVDSKKFLLIMNDSNLVYITLPKIEKMNKYNEIISEFEGKKGVLHLDLGSYFEIKE